MPFCGLLIDASVACCKHLLTCVKMQRTELSKSSWEMYRDIRGNREMTEELMTIREKSDVIIVDLKNDVGNQVASELGETLDELVGKKPPKIAVNLGNVEHINSAAVGALVGVARRMRQKGGDVKIYALAENLQRIFDLIGASSIVEIYESEGRAIAAF